MNNKQIKTLAKLAAKNNPLPILENALIKNGRIYASNLETEISYPFQLKNVEFMVSLADLAKIDFESMDIEGDFMLLKKGKSCVKLPIERNTEDYPKLRLFEPSTKIGDFKQVDVLKTAVNFVSKDQMLPRMCGVFIDENIVATDAHRLYYHVNKSKLRGMIVPPVAITMLDEESYSASVQKAENSELPCCLVLKGKDQEVCARLIEGNYPQYGNVIPNKCKAVATVSAKDLLPALEGAMKINKISSLTKLVFGDGYLNISAENIDYHQKFEDEVPAVWNRGENKFTIGISGKLLFEMLKSTKVQDVKFYLGEENRAICINDFGLIMPMMINEDSGWAQPIEHDLITEWGSKHPEVKEETKVIINENEKTGENLPDTEPAPDAEAQQPDADHEPAPEAAPEAQQFDSIENTVILMEYTEKSIVVIGDTREFKDKFKESFGSFNTNLNIKGVKIGGWVFSKKRRAQVEEILNS